LGCIGFSGDDFLSDGLLEVQERKDLKITPKVLA
jgi:hypothetical protein